MYVRLRVAQEALASWSDAATGIFRPPVLGAPPPELRSTPGLATAIDDFDSDHQLTPAAPLQQVRRVRHTHTHTHYPSEPYTNHQPAQSPKMSSEPQTKKFQNGERTIPHASQQASKYYPAEDVSQARKVCSRRVGTR